MYAMFMLDIHSEKEPSQVTENIVRGKGTLQREKVLIMME